MVVVSVVALSLVRYKQVREMDTVKQCDRCNT